MMKYKGYCGSVRFDDEADIFHGEVTGLRDVITFQGSDCHIEPDWVLIYRVEGESLYLECTGTHSDLFKK